MQILVVEDDPVVAQWVRRVLERGDDRVDVASTVNAALAATRAVDYDVAVVDLGLPDRDGLVFVNALRGRGRRLAVIILTARDGEDEIAAGLDAGADDYVTKPVSATVLRARVRAVLRRGGGAPESAAPAPAEPGSADVAAGDLTVNDLTLSRATRRVRGPAGEAELTAKEYALLEYLLARPGEVVAREQLLRHAWGYTFSPRTNVVEVAISRVRQKIAAVGSTVRLRTLRGMGVTLA